MKLAYASSAFARAIDRGDCTQIEFVELCAREIACDGVVLDVAQFPRLDDDYLAQIRKMATDLGLDIAAVADASFFTSDEAAMQRSLALVRTLGAPLLAAPLAAETTLSWSEQRDRLAAATSLAKAANVTLALRDAPGTFAAGAHELKRVSKEADSAWLRFAITPEHFAPDDLAALASNTVLLWSRACATASVGPAFAAFRGYLVLDNTGGAADAANAKAQTTKWRAPLEASNRA